MRFTLLTLGILVSNRILNYLTSWFRANKVESVLEEHYEEAHEIKYDGKKSLLQEPSP